MVDHDPQIGSLRKSGQDQGDGSKWVVMLDGRRHGTVAVFLTADPISEVDVDCQ